MNASWFDTWRLASRRRPEIFHWAEQHRPGIRFVETPVATVRVRTGGAGPHTVVLVPDPPNLIEHYDEVFDGLSRFCRVVCFEGAGFGFSFPKPGFGFTLAEQTGVAAEVLKAIDAGPYVLAFPCVAAYVALKLAERHPELVERLVLIQAPSWSEEQAWVQRIDTWRVLRTPLLGQLAVSASPHLAAVHWYRKALEEEPLQARFLPRFDEGHARGACFCLGSALQGLFNGPAPHFGEIPHPALVLWGESDPTHRDTDKGSLQVYLQESERESFASAGHFPELEEAERFVGRVREFLA